MQLKSLFAAIRRAVARLFGRRQASTPYIYTGKFPRNGRLTCDGLNPNAPNDWDRTKIDDQAKAKMIKLYKGEGGEPLSVRVIAQRFDVSDSQVSKVLAAAGVLREKTASLKRGPKPRHKRRLKLSFPGSRPF